MRIPQTLYVFAEYSFFCGAFVELDAAGFPFAAVNPFAMSDTPTVVLLYTALYAAFFGSLTIPIPFLP